MGNKRVCAALCILGALLVSPAVYAADYWTGDGGSGKSLAINAPKGTGLPAGQTLTSVVQVFFYSTLSKYSAIEVQDWEMMVATEKMREMRGERDVQDVGQDFVSDYLLDGSIIKTSTAFVLNIKIQRTDENKPAASHSGTYTQQELEEGIAVNKASLDLLGQMGVTLTALAKTELQRAASRQDIEWNQNTGKGLAADLIGDDVVSLALYNLANTIDPSRMETANRVSILSANIRTGNIGNDRRNDIQWRNDWRARLEETERYFDNFFKTFNQPYALLYTPSLQYGDTNYRDETVPVSFKVELLEQANWTDPVLKTVNTVWQGLNATRRKAAWGFEDWPRSSVSNAGPFRDGSKRLTIAVELVNDQKKVAARQTFEVRGRWDFSFNRDVGIQKFTSSGEAEQTVRFPSVKAGDLTERMTLNFTTVNNMPVADASKNGILMITTRSEYRDLAGFDLTGHDKDGYNREGYKGGFNRDGYNHAGYDRDGYNREGYDRNGYNRNGFDRNGFDKEGRMADGSRYNAAGYDKDGYDRDGNKNGSQYDRAGYNKNGYKRWSPVSSYFEALYTLHSGFGNGAAHGFTLGLFGVYASFSYNRAVSEELVYDSSTGDEETETTTKVSLGEFVVGYTLNVMPTKKGRLWGLGVSLGAGRNNLKNQLVMETGLQFRFPLIWLPLEIRGTYRTVGFKNSSFTMSIGLGIGTELNQ
jgi:hypothetical protein